MSEKSFISLRSFSSLSKSQLLFIGFGITGASGGFVLVKDLEFAHRAMVVFDDVMIDSVRSYLLNPFSEFSNFVRNGLFLIGDKLFEWSDSREGKASEFSLTKKSIIELPRQIVVGGKKVFVTAKDLTVSFFRFLFSYLPKFIFENGIDGVKDYIDHYLRPIKSLFTRPVDNRLRSLKTRMDQFVDCLKTPGFFDSLVSVNRFFVLFKDKIKTLDDAQMAEIIDIYLDDPMEMKAKVEAIFENLDIEKDKVILDKFDADLMMDFVRGENIEKLKATLASARVSESVANISETFASFFSSSRAIDVRLKASKNAGEKFDHMFTGAVSLWNGLFG